MAWRRKDKEQEEVSSIPPLPRELKEVQREVEKEMIVTELPQLPTRKIRGDDGVLYNLTTLSEAVQEILENTREILKIARED